MDKKLLEEVARATSLREGAIGVETLIRAVHSGEGRKLSDIARAARLPLPVATAVRRELEKRGLLSRGHGLQLTDTGRAFVEDSLGLAAPLTLEAPKVPGSELPPPLNVALMSLLENMANAPRADVSLDQAPASAETSIRRAALLQEAGMLEGRRVLIVGDDDSVSLAIGFLGLAVGRQLARRLAIVEIDPARIAFIREIALKNSIQLDIFEHDLRKPLPGSLVGAFDVFQTDPPYTLEGLALFSQRGVEALEDGSGYAMLSFGHLAPRERLAAERVLVSLGLATTALYPAFNRYDGASVLGSISELRLLIATGRHAESVHWTGPLYTAEVRPRERAYACTNCGKIWVLGRGRVPKTIEELKEIGCPACGNYKFTRS